MPILKRASGTLSALVATVMMGAIVGMLPAILFTVVIALVAMIINTAEARMRGEAQRTLLTAEHATFGTVLAVMAVWTTIGLYGPRDAAGLVFATVSAMVIVVGASILRAALTREPFVSVTGG